VSYIEIDGIRYETLPLLQKIFNHTVLNPLVNYVIPAKILTDFISKSKSPLVRESILRPGGWRAMRISYENGEPRDWIDKRILKDAVLTLIVGIGTGPGFNVLEAMVDARTDKVFAYCIDEDADAFEFGKKLAGEMGLSGRVNYITGNAVNLEHLLEVVPHIVKMVGILEYLTDDQVKELFRVSHRMLPSGGSILVNSMRDTHGVDRYLRRVFNWHLNYRSPQKILSLFEECGFGDFNHRSDPLGVYSIVVASKR
jgi:SAM-dependent methyltransferase